MQTTRLNGFRLARNTPLALALALAFAPAMADTPALDAAWRAARASDLARPRVAASETRGRRAQIREALIHRAASARPAATIAVQNCSDSGAGSLREAFVNAVSGDTIDLTHLGCSTISLTSGALPTGVDDLTLTGPGEHALEVDAHSTSSSIYHFGSGTLAASGLTFLDGSYEGNAATGGCLYSRGNVVLSHVTVRGCGTSASFGYKAAGGGVYTLGDFTLSDGTMEANVASAASSGAFGGGVAAHGNVSIARSSFVGNKATIAPGQGSFAYGGGLATRGDAILVSSTFSGNAAALGGALALYGTNTALATAIVNCTLSGNAASTAGGGATIQQPFRIANTTVSANSGGGILALRDADLESTLLSGNVSAGTTPVPSDFEASTQSTVSGANNLIGATTASVPPDTLTGEPLLLPLAQNGGATLTQALGQGSIAIDNGNNSLSLTTDQRGQPRVVGARSDIGAYERQDDMIFVDGFD